jgi:hypothetical protein
MDEVIGIERKVVGAERKRLITSGDVVWYVG